jgi:hypothetical protein
VSELDGKTLLLNHDIQAAKKRKSWNPFQKLTGEAEARSAAKSGAIVAGYLSLGYLVAVTLAYWTGKDLFGNADTSIDFLLIINAIGAVLGAFLAWRILARQPLWAAIFAAAWYAFEIAMKLEAIVEHTAPVPNVGFIFMFVALAAGAILAVRGSWALRVLRRSANRP